MGRTSAHQKYRLEDGSIVPGVTTIINKNLGWSKGALIGWARREALAERDPNKVRDESAEIGTVAHALVEEYLQHKYLGEDDFVAFDREDYSPKVISLGEQGFHSFLEYESTRDIEVQHAELQLVSEKYEFGGTIDIVGMVDGVPSIIDLKTSSGIYGSHKIQISAYRYLYYENFGEWFRPYILQIDKNDTVFNPYQLSDRRAKLAFKTFVHLREVHKALPELK